MCSLSSTAAWAPGMTCAQLTSGTRGSSPRPDRGTHRTQRWGHTYHHMWSRWLVIHCYSGEVSDTGGHPHSGGEMSRQGELLSPGLPGDPGQWAEGPLPHCQVSWLSEKHSDDNNELCRKYVEVLYKCKPVSFRSRVVCGGEHVSLSCSTSSTRYKNKILILRLD